MSSGKLGIDTFCKTNFSLSGSKTFQLRPTIGNLLFVFCFIFFLKKNSLFKIVTKTSSFLGNLAVTNKGHQLMRLNYSIHVQHWIVIHKEKWQPLFLISYFTDGHVTWPQNECLQWNSWQLPTSAAAEWPNSEEEFHGYKWPGNHSANVESRFAANSVCGSFHALIEFLHWKNWANSTNPQCRLLAYLCLMKKSWSLGIN